MKLVSVDSKFDKSSWPERRITARMIVKARLKNYTGKIKRQMAIREVCGRQISWKGSKQDVHFKPPMPEVT